MHVSDEYYRAGTVPGTGHPSSSSCRPWHADSALLSVSVVGKQRLGVGAGAGTCKLTASIGMETP